MSIRVDDLDTLAREERDGTGPEAFRASLAAEDERIAAWRPASPERHGELLREAHRQVRFAQPVPVWAWLGSLAGAAVVGIGFGVAIVALIDLVTA